MTAKQECERLMNELLPLAKRLLAEHGEFWPFGGIVERDGEVAHVSATSDDERGAPGELVQVLEDGFRERAGTLRAAAIVVNVTAADPATRQKVDAIEVRLDHVDGYSVSVLFPYALGEGKLELRAPFATEGERFAFGGRAGSA